MPSLIVRALRKAHRITNNQLANVRRGPRVAIIGCGRIAPAHVSAFQSTGYARVIAAADLSPAALGGLREFVAGLRTYRDYVEMLQDIKPDLVSICTWPQSHAEITREAVKVGVKGIMCEKPVALTIGDIESMMQVCDQNGVRLAGGHQYRFHPLFLNAASLVRAGKIGKPEQITGVIRSNLANNGPHLVDTIRFLLADPEAERVSSTCERHSNTFDRGYAVETGAKSEVHFAGGVRCDLLTGERADAFFEIRIKGTNGELLVSPTELRVNGTQIRGAHDATMNACRHAQFAEFIQWVEGKRQSYAADATQSMKAAEIVLGLYESARLGHEVGFPLRTKTDVIGLSYPEAQAEAVEAMEEPAAFQAELMRIRKTPELAMDGGEPAVRKWFGGSPKIGVREVRSVARVVMSGMLNSVGGTVVRQFEKDFAHFYGSELAVASSSGTASLHVATAALNLNPGDEVITTPISDMGSVIPILACNCIPVWADIDPRSGNMTAKTISDAITPRTKAVILVHLFGRPAELDEICELVKSKGIALIEDCSQAHNAEYKGKKVGTFGDFGCFSLQQSKQITCGDGGVTLVNRRDCATRARLYVDKGWDRRPGGSRQHEFLGMNYRMTEMQGAVARVQLGKLPGLTAKRRSSASELAGRLSSIEGIVVQPDSDDARSAWWIFNFSLDRSWSDITSKAFAQAMNAEGVPVRTNYLSRPLFDEPLFRNRATFGTSGYPLEEFEYQTPSIEEYPGLQEFLDNQFIIPWSHNANPAIARKIGEAVAKVASATERKSLIT